jgi:prophage regulatory protein
MPAQKNLRVLRFAEVRQKTGLGRDSIYRLPKTGGFPRPFKLSLRASGWYEHEIDEWIEKRAATRDNGTAPVVTPPPNKVTRAPARRPRRAA